MLSENLNKEQNTLQYWVSRWDSMQEYYNPDRKERFASLISLIEPWKSFWNDYLNLLGEDAKIKRVEALGNWNGVEEGLPLDWHFENLKMIGFQCVDCFTGILAMRFMAE